ncbi:TetR/AcrR family transcriptional regulator [Alcaligenes aquatilis]|uniref:TetR family transcriptional regulator n=1 Tax=Alcaligenes aquatilis TaxID=323284 RepID=A0A3G2HVK4_9BURK|nr:TetR/AcrR family transcriptional regulator C-terminal domain-containing protein [Alcaligenes aquatilis]AYN21077.1 TetR family transcriptional regulator [Alcaligenes aquatilis]
MAQAPSTRTRKLNKDELAIAAVTLMEEAGDSGFSLRKLGERVGCDPMAVLYHFKSKEGLLRAMADYLTSRIQAVDTELAWAERLYELARQYRELALKHPQTFRQMQRFLNTGKADYRVLEQVYRALHDAGLSNAEIPAACVGWYAALYGLIQGELGGLIRPVTEEELSELEQWPAEDVPMLRQILPRFVHLQSEQVFKMMMELIHDGLIAHAGKAATTATKR